MTTAPADTTSPPRTGPVRRRLDALWAWLEPLRTPERRIDLVGGMTVLVLLLASEETWIVQVGVVSLAAAAVIAPRLFRSAGYWFVVLAVYVAGVFNVVLLIDNHEFLIGYWLLALAISRLQPDPDAAMGTSARLLLGFTFAFATIWKVATPEYADGNAFHTMLLFERRFAGVPSMVSSLTFAEGLQNYSIYEVLRAVGDGAVTQRVLDAPGVRTAAVVMTWWTVLIEGLVAVCFLVPPTTTLGRARHVMLLVFLGTTYVLAPVLGFGWILIALALAQAPLQQHRLYLPAYALAFVLVLVRKTAPLGRIFEVLFPNLF